MAFLKRRPGELKVRLIGALVTFVTGIVALTWRVIAEGRNHYEELLESGRPFVLVFWHGEMLMGWYFHRHRNYNCLVSMSKDGDVLAGILKRWKYNVIRGSSSRGGKEARRIMEAVIRDNKILVVTPDGPRGPKYEMKMGAIRTAQRTGVPVLAVRCIADAGYRFKSWDRFTIPLPFSKITLRYLEPNYIEPGLEGEALSREREKLQLRMNGTSAPESSNA